MSNLKQQKISFQWDIKGLGECDLVADEYFESPIFNTSCETFKSDWKLRLYPSGCDSTAEFCYRLIRIDTLPEFFVKCTISFLDQFARLLLKTNYPESMTWHYFAQNFDSKEVSKIGCRKIFVRSILFEMEMFESATLENYVLPEIDVWPTENNLHMRGITQIVPSPITPVTKRRDGRVQQFLISCGQIVLLFEYDGVNKMRLIDKDHIEIDKVFIKAVCVGSATSARYLTISREMCLLEDANMYVEIYITSRCLIETNAVAFQSSTTAKTADMRADFRRILSNPQFGDVSIVVGDKTLRAHQDMLGVRSQVFAAMFSEKWLDKSTAIVTIKEFDFSTIRAMIEYIYQGGNNLWHDKVDPVELLKAAEMYQLDHLKIVCEQRLSDYLDKDNIFERIVLISTYDLPLLKNAAAVFTNDKRTLKFN